MSPRLDVLHGEFVYGGGRRKASLQSEDGAGLG